MALPEGFIEKVRELVPSIEYAMERMKDMSLPEVFAEFLPGSLGDGHSKEDRIMLAQLYQHVQHEEAGWTAHYVFDSPDTPDDERMVYGLNAHTHGLEANFGHPDLQIVLNIPPAVCGGIFSMMVDTIKEGGSFTNTTSEYMGVLNGLNIKTQWAKEGERSMLRVILPDESGCLDSEKMDPTMVGQYVGTTLVP